MPSAGSRSRSKRVHYYLSRFVGTGADDAPFRPEVASAAVEWSAIDLRGDASKVGGYCIAVVDTRPAPDPSTAVYLGTDSEAAIKAATLDSVRKCLGVALTADENTIQAITTALLTKYASAVDPSKPDPLQGDSVTLGNTWAV